MTEKIPAPENNREKEIARLRERYRPDADGFVNFGDIAMGELRQQTQYASRYVYGSIEGYPNLGDGLRFKEYEEGRSNYHALKIHVEDVPAFVKRYQEYQEEKLK